MHKRMIIELADALEHHKIKDVGYNQETICYTSGTEPDRGLHGCRTVGCVAGNAVALFLGKKALKRAYSIHDIEEWNNGAMLLAASLLGLTKTQAVRLFESTSTNADSTPKQAARVLRRLAATGRVDWAWAMKED